MTAPRSRILRRARAATTGTTTAGAAAPSPRGRTSVRTGVRAAAPAAAAPTGPDLLHLLRRTTFGLTPGLVARARSLGAARWLEQQLAPASIPDPVCDAVVARWPALALSSTQVHQAVDAGQFAGWQLQWMLVRASIARAAWSERQLLEVMVHFWSDHLAVACPSDNVWDVRHRYDADVIRRYAFGSFADMLAAAVRHPAMLRYLTNSSSTKQHPNENLGRELLELHTVGLEARFTETDVVNAARILTGTSCSWATGEPNYRKEWHWTGPVRVLGFEHPNADPAGGPVVVEALARYLAAHPETARRIATKLAVRFVSDNPPATLVDRLARTYLANGTAIVPVLRELFSSSEFAASAGQKVRRPFEDVVATLRVLGWRPDPSGTKGPEALGWLLNDLGHAPFGWPAPNGFPDVSAAWSSPAARLGVWNTHVRLAAGWWPADTLVRDPLTTLFGTSLPATHGALVDALAQRLFVGPLTSTQRDAVCRFADASPDTKLTARSDAVTWRLPYVVALLLDLPQHSTR